MVDDLRFAEPETPAWHEAWGKLKQDMAGLALRVAWRKLRGVVAANPSYPTAEALALMKAVVTPPEGDVVMRNEVYGESWQYMGTAHGTYTDNLTGKQSTGWFHQFRHRACPLENDQRTYRNYLASQVPPGKEVPKPALVVVGSRRFQDNGEPF